MSEALGSLLEAYLLLALARRWFCILGSRAHNVKRAYASQTSIGVTADPPAVNLSAGLASPPSVIALKELNQQSLKVVSFNSIRRPVNAAHLIRGSLRRI
jgi:hypothetical protein